MKKLVFVGAVGLNGRNFSSNTGKVKRASRITIVLLATILSAAPITSESADMSVTEVLADGCVITPDNFVFSDFWNSKMGVLESWCDYPSITKSDLDGRRKPLVFPHGSTNINHDIIAVKMVNGTGENGDTLGVAPRTTTTLGLYCTDASSLIDAKAGDSVFKLREGSEDCSFLSPVLPTIPIFGQDNLDRFVGNQKASHGIQISSGANYGLAIDYFSPGGARSIIGGGNVSFAQSEFAGIVAALNSALLSNNHAALTNDTIKEALDASSDEVYLEVAGFRNIYNESEVDALLDSPSTKYYGQIVNLSNAIDYTLTNSPELMLFTIIKNVNNDDGGNAIPADFILRVTGGDYDPSVPRSSGDSLVIIEGEAYALSEDTLRGYTQTNIACTDDDTLFTLSHPVTLVARQSATCVISNDDVAPQLTIIKQVTGGDAKETDFTLHLFGGNYDASIPRKSGDIISVKANTSYIVSEDPMQGYLQAGILCKDDNTSAGLGHPLTLSEGQSATCTINNRDYVSTYFVIPLPDNGAAVFDL